jgi:acetolactate synthase-1/2/3 large subunit
MVANSKKYSDQFMDWMRDIGYTHCFYLGGGNVMHLLESASQRFECKPFVNEIGAGIAADYFNEVSEDKKAFVLVTAGPALTNLMTAIAGAWTESRELLVIGGQAKVSDLSRGKYRQIGFQEIDGVSICRSITKASVTIEVPITKQELYDLCSLTWEGRKGPVFLEFCLDVSALPKVEKKEFDFMEEIDKCELSKLDLTVVKEIAKLVSSAKRPVLLIGGELSRADSEVLMSFREWGIPIATTFNGADRVGVEYPYYCGRPNWYGSRWSNLLIQQADLVVAVGTRLGLLQVGYNWKEFAPVAKLVHVYVDETELEKGFPKVDYKIKLESKVFLENLSFELKERNFVPSIEDWQEFIINVRSKFAVPDKANRCEPGHVELHSFIFNLFERLNERDIIIPCSSGGTYTGTMQVLLNKEGQRVVTSNALASMGVGLSGAIGASLAEPGRRTILLEGDGGFAQNLQELGTLKANKLNLKIFLSDNRGYASIRTTQKTYFNNHYVGCDENTGLGLPDWEKIAEAYGIRTFLVTPETAFNDEFERLMNAKEPVFFVVKLDPDQLYFPKLGSRIGKDGIMQSAPLHQMDPPLSLEEEAEFLRYLKA